MSYLTDTLKNDTDAVEGFFKCVLGDRLKNFNERGLKGHYLVEFEMVGGDNLDLIRSRFKITKITGDTEEPVKIWVETNE